MQRTFEDTFGRQQGKFDLQILLVLLKSCDLLKQWSVPVWYSIKMHESCVKGLKTYNPFRGALKIHLEGSNEIFLLKV